MTSKDNVDETSQKRFSYRNSKSQSLRFDGRVAIVTGAGRGIGRSLAILYARRGARVIVNDIGCSVQGDGYDKEYADSVVNKIREFGGEAIADYNSVSDSHLVIKTAIEAFGRVDILVCNAGVYKEATVENVSEDDWDLAMETHLHASYGLTSACWKYFLKQGYGRIAIAVGEAFKAKENTSVYATTKMALLGFSQSLAIEGKKYGILCNSYAPVAYTNMTSRNYVDYHQKLKYVLHPKKVAPLVAYLTHDSCNETGSLFRVGLSLHYKVEFQDAVKFNLPSVVVNECDLELKGRIAIVTGADQGLGKLISEKLSLMGAQVIGLKENDDGSVIRIPGDYSLTTPQQFITSVIDETNRVDILINCAANLDTDFHSACRHQLGLAFVLAHGLWDQFKKQSFGRIINVAPMNCPSTETIEMGLTGLSSVLACEGGPFGIFCNTLVGTFELKNGVDQPSVIMACLLAHPGTSYNGALLESSFSNIYLVSPARSLGLDLNNLSRPLPTWNYMEALQHNWKGLNVFPTRPVINAGLPELIIGPDALSVPGQDKVKRASTATFNNTNSLQRNSQLSCSDLMYASRLTNNLTET